MDGSYRAKRIDNRYISIPNIDAVHMGLELEVSYRPLTTLTLGGIFSLDDWK